MDKFINNPAQTYNSAENAFANDIVYCLNASGSWDTYPVD